MLKLYINNKNINSIYNCDYLSINELQINIHEIQYHITCIAKTQLLSNKYAT